MNEAETAVATQETVTVPAPAPIVEPIVRGSIDRMAILDVCRAVQCLTDEAKLVVGPDGFTINTVDPAHVAMVQVHAPANAFQSWVASAGEIGVDLDKLQDYAKLVKGVVDFKVDANALVLSQPTGSRNVTLLDTAGLPTPRVPTLNLPARALVPVDNLVAAMRQAKVLTDHVAFKTSGDKLTLHAEGESDSYSANVGITTDIAGVASLDVKSLFSLDYLQGIFKAAPKNTVATLDLGTDYPVRIQWESRGINYTFLLAPRIEND